MLWLTLASPKEQTTTLSEGTGEASPSLRVRRTPIAIPTALGRWLAMVLVCGNTHIGALPQTLCRPPETGSSALAT